MTLACNHYGAFSDLFWEPRVFNSAFLPLQGQRFVNISEPIFTLSQLKVLLTKINIDSLWIESKRQRQQTEC
jgi:hypothetical protein